MEVLVVRNPAVLASMLQYDVGELRLRPSLALNALDKRPSLRSVEQQASVGRVIRSSGIFMVHRPPNEIVVDVLERHAEWLEMKDGEVLYEEGQPLDGVYCIVSGGVNIMCSKKSDGHTDTGAEGVVKRKEVAVAVTVGGVLVGKTVEAFAGNQKDGELRTKHIKEAAHEMLDREIEREKVLSLRKQEQKIRDSLASKTAEIETLETSIETLNRDLHTEEVQVMVGGDAEVVNTLSKQRDEVLVQLEETRREIVEMQAVLEPLQDEIKKHEKDFEIHDKYLHEAEALQSKDSENMHVLGDDEKDSLKRHYTAIVAGDSRILKFPITSWKEACECGSIFLSFRTFIRQYESAQIPITKLVLGASGVGFEVKEGQDKQRETDPPTDREEDVAIDPLHAHVHLSKEQLYVAANTAMFLPNFDLLMHMTPHSLLRLVLHSKMRVFDPFTVITVQGCSLPVVDENQVGYLIFSGRVSTHKKPTGTNVDSDKWHALQHQLLQMQRRDPTFKGVAADSAICDDSSSRFAKEAVAAARDCFGPPVCALGYMGHGSVLGENLWIGIQTESPFTYMTCSKVWALEVPLKVFHHISEDTTDVIRRPHIAAAILKKDAKARDSRDNEMLAGCVHKVPFFEMFPPQALVDVCGKMQLRTLEPGQGLFKQDDDASEVFVVFSGALSVHANIKETEHDRERLSLGWSNALGFHHDMMKKTPAHGSFKHAVREVLKLGPTTGTRKVGDSIGQAVCFNTGTSAKRNSTVIAREKTACIVLTTQDLALFSPFFNIRAFFNAEKLLKVLFDHSLRSDDDLLAIGEFMRTLTLLSTLKHSELMPLAKHVRAEYMPKGTILYRNESCLSSLYFLGKGAAAVCTPAPYADTKSVEHKNAQCFDASHLHIRHASVGRSLLLCSRSLLAANPLGRTSGMLVLVGLF
jgi:CRP-like cAMP-binding protein